MISIKWSETAPKKCTGQRGCNCNPVAALPHAAVVFRVQPFNFILNNFLSCSKITRSLPNF